MLEQLTVDGKKVKPEYVEIKDRRGTVSDSYYFFAMPEPTAGNHNVKAVFRSLKFNTTKDITETFSYPVSSGKNATVRN